MFMFLNSSSMMLFWVMMEVNMISLIFMMFSYSEEPHSEKSLNAFSYLIVQTMGSVMFFISMLSENSTPHYLSSILLSLSLITKMGIFPMQMWVFKMAPLLTPFILSILLSFQKMPLIMLIVATNMETSLMIMMSSVIMGSLMLIFSKSLMELSISSSIYFTFWAWMIAQYSILSFFLSYCIYFIVTMVLLKTQKSLTSEGSNKSLSISIVILSFFLIGLPPASMFFFKLVSMELMINSMGTISIFIIWVSVFWATIGYTKMLIPCMSSVESITGSSKSLSMWTSISILAQLAFIVIMLL